MLLKPFHAQRAHAAQRVRPVITRDDVPFEHDTHGAAPHHHQIAITAGDAQDEHDAIEASRMAAARRSVRAGRHAPVALAATPGSGATLESQAEAIASVSCSPSSGAAPCSASTGRVATPTRRPPAAGRLAGTATFRVCIVVGLRTMHCNTYMYELECGRELRPVAG